MELRLAAMVTPSYRFDLPALVRQVYGSDAAVGPAQTSVMAALDPDRPYALTYAGHHWLFDWDKIENWLSAPAISRGFHAVFALHETADFYAFAMYDNGDLGRLRIGTVNGGVISDVGPVLDPEIATIARLFGMDRLDEGLSYWYGNQPAQNGSDHDWIGEQVVVDLIAYQTGIYVTEINKSSSDFFSMRASTIVSPASSPLSRFHRL